ncbi:MAG TPA: hypothetical protein VEW42_04900 [Candidatus Eisenbacteria bacterium]|nr:hypothetical protein [Candidatus Eisenbacteria bacterium]
MIDVDSERKEEDRTHGWSNQEKPSGAFGWGGNPSTERTPQNYTPEPNKRITPSTGRPGAPRRV